MKKLIACSLFVFFLVGCAWWRDQSPMLELVVRAATGRVLTENPSWVEPTYTISSEVIFIIETGLTAEIGGLDLVIIEKLPEFLTPEEQALAIVLIGTLKEAIISDLARREIKDPEEIRVRVVQILSWINQTASFRR